MNARRLNRNLDDAKLRGYSSNSMLPDYYLGERTSDFATSTVAKTRLELERQVWNDRRKNVASHLG